MTSTQPRSPVRQNDCRATAPHIWPAIRCTEHSGHGQAHHSADGVFWVGQEPPERVLLSGGPFSGEHVAPGAVPQSSVLILLPDDRSRVARYGRSGDVGVYVFCGFDDVVRTGGEG